MKKERTSAGRGEGWEGEGGRGWWQVATNSVKEMSRYMCVPHAARLAVEHGERHTRTQTHRHTHLDRERERQQRQRSCCSSCIGSCAETEWGGRGVVGGAVQVALLLRVCNRFESYIKTESGARMGRAKERKERWRENWDVKQFGNL